MVLAMKMSVLDKGRLVVILIVNLLVVNLLVVNLLIVNVVIGMGVTGVRTEKALVMGTTVRFQATLDMTRKITDGEYRVILS